RRKQLLSVIEASESSQLQSHGFVLRVLAASGAEALASALMTRQSIDIDECIYGGFPAVTYLGFLIGAGRVDVASAAPAFLAGLERIRQRPTTMQSTLRADDVALLGLADGL